MKIYLARHGEAEGEFSLQRPLTEKGKADVKRLADFLQPFGALVSHIYCSEKLRAQQTAEIFATTMAPGQEIHTIPQLSGNDSIGAMMDEIEGYVDDTLLVGHIPFLPRLLSQLVVGNENKLLVDFRPATLVCLQRMAYGQWIISWVLRPDLIPKTSNDFRGLL